MLNLLIAIMGITTGKVIKREMSSLTYDRIKIINYCDIVANSS